MTLCICIFSYNRGNYLKNCIASVESCAPESKIVIFDDGSDDPDTLKTLAEIGKKHAVVQPGHASSHHLGGLYGNMQSALDFCKEEEILCFLQDDTQLVRGVTAEDMEVLTGAFDRNPHLGFLHPCFIKAINLKQGASFSYDPSLNLYFHDPTKRSAGRYFSALLITKPSRLLAAGWRFAASEPANSRLAQKYFLPMGYLFAPFAMWLPEVPAYRGKKKTFALRLAEKKRRCGYYPYRIMDPAEVKRLKERSPSVLPVAEAFLACDGKEPSRPWAYNPLTGLRWLKLLNQLEVSLRRLFKP
ncbi:MAG: glycosyltransferase [Desulfosalsimonadaceae bacterium]